MVLSLLQISEIYLKFFVLSRYDLHILFKNDLFNLPITSSVSKRLFSRFSVIFKILTHFRLQI